MNRRMIWVLAGVALALVLFVSAGAAQRPETDAVDHSALERTPDDPRLFQPGRLTVATGDPVYPPWMLHNDPARGEGFENGLVYALAERLGFDRQDVVWVSQTFDEGIAPGPKRYDFSIQQFSVTEPRRQVVDFSTVYFRPDKAVISLPASRVVGATSYAQLREARWGATIGTTDLDYIERIIGARNVAVFDDQVGTFHALLGGQIDATVAALPTALFATAVQVPEAQISALLPHDPADPGHGLLFQKGNPILSWINEALEELIAEGVVDRLAAQYLVGDIDAPVISH
ncbi:MAG: amino acid ABC transporter substrate-binding protein [Spirochaetaceae bacterium]|nr:MAG: amino acid ABC transporter substrate-binding protein [Spirochaetaceae bacterium]